MDCTRRALLASTASAAAAPALAGCSTSAAPAVGGYAAVYALADVADAVAGDRLDVACPVPTSVHGHGWRPAGDLQARVAESDLFVYLDHPQFAWSRTYARHLADEPDVDVHLLDALEGVDLLEWQHGGHGHGGGANGGDDHAGEDHDIDASGGPDDRSTSDDRSSTADRSTSADHSTSGNRSAAHGEARDRGRYDPHVWLDPVRTQAVVSHVADALVAIDPDGEPGYRERAAAYRDDLAAIHEAFVDATADAAHSTVVLAGHNSFQYVAERYGFEFVTPTGVSPDRQASQSDLVALIELVDRRGIDYVCYDAFEGDRYARAIVRNSGAREALALAPLTSRTQPSAEAGLGYREITRQTNLAHLRRAMGDG